MEHKTQNLHSIYSNFLDNRLSAKEISELLQKMEHISDGELEQMVAKFMDERESHPVPGEEESLDRILLSIRNRRLSEPSKHKIPFKIYRKWIAAAVVLLVPALVFFVFSQRAKNAGHIEIAAGSVDIAPGRDRATLKLANGTEIYLDTLHAGQDKIKQYGASISKQGNGELVYMKMGDAETAVVGYNTISTPRGGRYKVLLPDSTQVWLNASSSITYPTSFAHAGARLIKLEGEAYFAVKKVLDGKGKAQPFIVSTDRQKVTVLGTHFNVNAYADESSVRTTLLEGRVQVNSDAILRPGQQAVSFGKTLEVRDVDTTAFVDWKNNEFNLKTSDFRTTMRKIARWYDVEIIYDKSAPSTVKLGGWISRDKNISSVLKLIQKTGGVHFKLEGRRVTVTE